MLMKKLAAGAATAVIAMSIGAAAHAQSTAGQAQEVVVTGARAARSTGGQAVQVNEAKDEAIITKQFIATQVPSANLAQLINHAAGRELLRPRIRAGSTPAIFASTAFDGAHVAFILDGAPLNDTGNYAVYPGRIHDRRVDRPHHRQHRLLRRGQPLGLGPRRHHQRHVTKKPSQTLGRPMLKAFGRQLRLSAASIGEIDSGAFGPFGTTAYIAAENGREDNFERPSGRQRAPGHLRQASISRSEGHRLPQPYRRSSTPKSARTRPTVQPVRLGPVGRPRSLLPRRQLSTWVPETVAQSRRRRHLSHRHRRGHQLHSGRPAQRTAQAGAPKFSSDSNYYNLFSNPVNFAIHPHGQSKFTLLGHGLTVHLRPVLLLYPGQRRRLAPPCPRPTSA